MTVAQQQLTSTACALMCASAGSVHDLRTRKIPNMLSGPSMLAGVAMHAAFGGWHGICDSMFAGICAGSIALMFWIAGGMGAGDVKLVAAIACITGSIPLRLVLLATALAGGVIALGVSTWNGRLRETLRNVGTLLEHHQRRGLRPHPELNLKSANAHSLPFAVPVAVGCLVSLCSLIWEAHS